MNVRVARTAGFCFGVKRAIQKAFETAGGQGKVFSLGPLIHNPQAVERLRNRGVRVIGEPAEAEAGSVVIVRSHGVSPDVERRLSEKGVTIVDATCPFVKKAQNHAVRLRENGYQVVIVGERDHPEVMGIRGYAGEDALVIGPDDNPELLGFRGKVGIIAQTTQSLTVLQNVVSAAVAQASTVKVHNTICDATRQRQRESIALAGDVDVMLVVGGKNSANTKRLKTLCEEKGVRAFHVETADEIDTAWFNPTDRTVGITAGASTPEWIIEDVRRRMENDFPL